MFLTIKDISQKLHSDYNGDILEEIKDEKIKDAFKKVSKELREKNKGNTPLANIVYNHFHGTLPSPNYVSGPMSLSYQTSEEYDMKVYIFGEHHGNEKSCDKIGNISNSMYISEYLQQLFKNTDKFIDFYIEDQLFVSKQQNKPQFLLQTLIDDFHYCLNPAKRSQCVFKTVRTHFVDARQIEKDSVIHPTNSSWKLLMDVVKNNYEPLSVGKILENIKEIKRIRALETYESVADYVIETALSVPIVKKEFDRCYLDKKIFLNAFHEALIMYFKGTFDIEEIKSLSKKFDTKVIGHFLKFSSAPILEFYMIARIFKEFKKTNYFPQKPKYIIFYGGNAHSKIFRIFLNKLGFQYEFITQSDTKTSTRCLNMDGKILDFK